MIYPQDGIVAGCFYRIPIRPSRSTGSPTRSFPAFLGWQVGLVAIFFGILARGVLGVALLLLKLRGRQDAIPFGPFLALGGVVALFWGEAILRWYFL